MPLERRTPLRPRAKGKGNAAEREVVDLLRAYGWTSARRNFASGGYGGSDVVDGIPGVALEIKRQEACRIWSWIAQCEAAAKPTDTPIVVFRRNRSRWYGCLPLDDLLELLKLRET